MIFYFLFGSGKAAASLCWWTILRLKIVIPISRLSPRIYIRALELIC